MDEIGLACADVAAALVGDATLALNEAELQALLQAALMRRLPNVVPASLADGCLRRTHHPDLFVPRVYRELKPRGGRDGKEADIVILEDRLQVVEPKQNGAPARIKPPFAAILETKVDASALGMLTGKKVRPRPEDLLADIRKWRPYVDEGLVGRVCAVVLTAAPEAYIGLDEVLVIPWSAQLLQPWTPQDAVDPWPMIDASLEAVADEYARFPVSCIREKDFETRLLDRLRGEHLPRAALQLPDGRVVAIDAVRAQWSGTWSQCLGRGRRHDLVVLAPDGRSLLAELELKTSHSDSHNWFRKREVEAELDAMNTLTLHGHLKRGRFVMFRYGRPMWEEDAHTLFAKYPHVEFAYLSS